MGYPHGVPGTTSLLPKITPPEPVGQGKRNMGNSRSGSKIRPWGRGRRGPGAVRRKRELCTNRGHRPASRPPQRLSPKSFHPAAGRGEDESYLDGLHSMTQGMSMLQNGGLCSYLTGHLTLKHCIYKGKGFGEGRSQKLGWCLFLRGPHGAPGGGGQGTGWLLRPKGEL